MAETFSIGAAYQSGADARESYIRSRIEDQIAYYESKSQYNKKIYYATSILAVVTSALVPVVSVFMPSDIVPKLIITLLSATTTILTSLQVLFNAKDLWTKYRFNASRLTACLHQYYSHSGPFAGHSEEEAFQLLVQMSEAQMEDENKGWGTMFKHDAPPAQKP